MKKAKRTIEQKLDTELFHQVRIREMEDYEFEEIYCKGHMVDRKYIVETKMDDWNYRHPENKYDSFDIDIKQDEMNAVPLTGEDKFLDELLGINGGNKIIDAVQSMPDFEDYTYNSLRTLYNSIWQGVGFMNMTHRNLYQNTLVESMLDAFESTEKNLTFAQEEIMKIESYIYATDIMEKDPNYKYDEELIFFTQNKKDTGKAILEKVKK